MKYIYLSLSVLNFSSLWHYLRYFILLYFLVLISAKIQVFHKFIHKYWFSSALSGETIYYFVRLNIVVNNFTPVLNNFCPNFTDFFKCQFLDEIAFILKEKNVCSWFSIRILENYIRRWVSVINSHLFINLFSKKSVY